MKSIQKYSVGNGQMELTKYNKMRTKLSLQSLAKTNLWKSTFCRQ